MAIKKSLAKKAQDAALVALFSLFFDRLFAEAWQWLMMHIAAGR